jgi:hypothetical protein
LLKRAGLVTTVLTNHPTAASKAKTIRNKRGDAGMVWCYYRTRRLGGIEFFEINNPYTLLTRGSRLKVSLLKTSKENTNQQDGWFETIVVD